MLQYYKEVQLKFILCPCLALHFGSSGARHLSNQRYNSMNQHQQGDQQGNQKWTQPGSKSSKKYLSHFESINNPVKVPASFQTQAAERSNYGNALELYASSLSIIDKIVDSPVKSSHMVNNEAELQDCVTTPIVVNTNPRVKQRLQSINRFFCNDSALRYAHDDGDTPLNTYLKNLLRIDLSSQIISSVEESSKKRGIELSGGRSKSKQTKTINIGDRMDNLLNSSKPVQEAEVNTDPVHAEKQNSKLKKMDLLLVEIMKEKKRKGMVPDYFRAIEMKLVELLEYILRDQPGYFGMNLKQKMKEVLANLQSFKGKTIDGESKINMLRVFFEEFRSLKKERQQQFSNMDTQKSVSKKSNFKTHEVFDKGPSMFKAKKTYDTMSLGDNRSRKVNEKAVGKNNPSINSFQQEDQWIGSLDS